MTGLDWIEEREISDLYSIGKDNPKGVYHIYQFVYNLIIHNILPEPLPLQRYIWSVVTDCTIILYKYNLEYFRVREFSPTPSPAQRK